MPTSTDVTNLKINRLTEAQYDAAVQSGTITANELSIITDLDDTIQMSTLPTASASELGKIYQYIGATDVNYTNGYFYKCISDGQIPATYSWTQTNVQPQPEKELPTQAGNSGKYLKTNGVSASWAAVESLPDQTGQSGKFLTTNGTDASWSDKPFVQKDPDERGICIAGASISQVVTQYNSGNIVMVGSAAGNTSLYVGANSICIAPSLPNNVSITGRWGTLIGSYGKAAGKGSVALGSGAQATADSAIQICSKNQSEYGYSTATNSDANTFKVANYNGNYEIMSADGTIPTDRFTTTPVADGTYVPTVSISSGVATRSWTTPASAPVVPSTMPTLTVVGWTLDSGTNKYTQSVSVTGVTASNVVFVSPAPASAEDYASSNVICISQSADSLTFQADSVPENAITVNTVILG